MEKKRTSVYKKLKVFLSNPGKFCLIVLGSRGSGKHFGIETVFKEISVDAAKDLCLQNLQFIEANDAPEEADELNHLLKEHEYGTIVIEDVEELTENQQRLLFKALSTTDGTFGIGDKYNVRMVFTSSKDIDALRTDKDLLLGLFWDRISQLVVELPSFKEEEEEIVQYFYATWRKMKFEHTKGYEHFSGVPKNANLEKFLEDNAGNFDGGFRDLDKIACLYFHYRIYHYGAYKKIQDATEKKVLDSVKEDFFSKSQLHSESGYNESLFRFEIGFTHQELLGKYKMQLRKWAVKTHGTEARAEEKLGFKPGSLKNYVAGKVTTKHKEIVLVSKKK